MFIALVPQAVAARPPYQCGWGGAHACYIKNNSIEWLVAGAPIQGVAPTIA